MTKSRVGALPPEGFASISTVCALTSKSKPTIYRWVNAGIFPAPVRLGPNSVGFRVEQLREWLVDPLAWEAKGGGR